MGSEERIGVKEVGIIFEKIGYVFREQPIEDYGIDAIIEERDGNKLTGKLIAVQIKSGDSYFKETVKDKIIFRGKMKHYDYWINYSLPVLIVLYNRKTETCIYELVTKDKVTKTGKTWKIEIEISNHLEKAAAYLHNVAKNQSEYQKRLSTLVLDKELMKLANESKLVIEVGEWVNKISGKGDFIIKKIDDSGNEKVLFGKTIYGFGTRPYEKVIPEILPWAELMLDEEYYENNGDPEFIYCKKMENSDIYPYQNAACEVEWYRFIPKLNAVGKSFLMLDDFLNSGRMYNIEFD